MLGAGGVQHHSYSNRKVDIENMSYFEVKNGKLTGNCSMYQDTYAQYYQPKDGVEGEKLARESCDHYDNPGSKTLIKKKEFSESGEELKPQ